MNTKWYDSRFFWGGLLIAAGILFLLQNLDILPGGKLFGAIALGGLGVLFLSGYFSNRTHWWALIPGIILLSLAAVITVEAFFGGAAGAWSGAIFLGGIGLSFLAVYLAAPTNWWAIIPCGVMFTLATVSVLDEVLPSSMDTGGVFFLGLGATFAVVALLPTPHGRMKWAYIPAAALLLMGLFLLASAAPLVNYIWPLALILGGGALLFMALRPRS